MAKPVDLTAIMNATTKLQQKLARDLPLPGKIDGVTTIKVGGRSSKKKGVVTGKTMIVYTDRGLRTRRAIERKLDAVMCDLAKLFGYLTEDVAPGKVTPIRRRKS